MFPSTSRSQDDEFYKMFENLSIGSRKTKKSSTTDANKTEVKLNFELISEITTINPNQIFILTPAHISEIFRIKSLITNSRFQVDQIYKINCPFLKKAYELKKLEKMLYSGFVNEKELFHGTKRINVDNICKFNFSWRLHGTGTGNLYGRGVSFSTNAMYASNYSDQTCVQKVMILAKVLVGRTCKGNPQMTVPPPGYDSAVKGDGIVTVKFDDNEYCPAYRIEYHLKASSKSKRSRRGKAKRRNRYYEDDDFDDYFDYNVYYDYDSSD